MASFIVFDDAFSGGLMFCHCSPAFLRVLENNFYSVGGYTKRKNKNEKVIKFKVLLDIRIHLAMLFDRLFKYRVVGNNFNLISDRMWI